MSHLLERIYWSSRAFVKSRAEKTLPYRPIESILARQNRKIRSIVTHASTSVRGDANITTAVSPTSYSSLSTMTSILNSL